MRKTAANENEREHPWEILGWHEEVEPETAYCLWSEEQAPGAVLYLSNTEDQMETIDLKSREEIDELIGRLISARDALFPKS